MAGFSIDRRQLIVELSVADPVLKRVAEQVMRESFFDPAVAQLKEDFTSHPVTQEIAGGVHATNISSTLEAPFRESDDKDSPPNLTSFIGFDKSPEEVLGPIIQRLDSRHPDGPKLVYKGREKDQMTYRFEVSGPNEEALHDAAPIPWSEGLSWLKRIEQGIPGIGHFLNVYGRPSSRSGGGIQVDGQIRQGRFKPTSYLTKMLNNFLRRAGGRKDTGRPL